MKKLSEYPPEDIYAAMKKKSIQFKEMSEELGRNPGTISRAIKGTSGIRSVKLEQEIVQMLQPELDIIHQAFCNMMNSETISPELRLQIVEV